MGEGSTFVLCLPAPGMEHTNGGPPDERPASEAPPQGRGAVFTMRLRRAGATSHNGPVAKNPPAAPEPPRPNQRSYAASFALLAYMSTYSCPDSRMTSAITESVTARRT